MGAVAEVRGYIVEAGTPAYWVTYLGEAPIFTPCRVVAVERTPEGEALAVFQTKYVQSAGIVGTAVVARKATRVHVGQRAIVAPSVGAVCAEKG